MQVELLQTPKFGSEEVTNLDYSHPRYGSGNQGTGRLPQTLASGAMEEQC